MNEKNSQNDHGAAKPDDPKQKHVGDETPNPLPDADYTVKRPKGDDNFGSDEGTPAD